MNADASTLSEARNAVLIFLRAFERAQQDILFNDVALAQDALRGEIGSSLQEARSVLQATEVAAPATPLGGALDDLVDAYEKFLSDKTWPDYGVTYLASRGAQCRALEVLYRECQQWPEVAGYFSLVGAQDAIANGSSAFEVGISHHEMTSEHGEYSLYVPEDYSPDRTYPLIVCLHGSHGHGNEYIWTWLRAARSIKAILLSPKSYQATWSFMDERIDADSILAMIDRLESQYRIDKEKILLSGLSDGGTFSYWLALAQPQRFRALAPVAGVLPPSAERFLRAGVGKDVDMHVVHGAKDMIFPVQTVRSTSALLLKLGYSIEFTELPEWGHALTYSINEQILLPWFESLTTS